MATLVATLEYKGYSTVNATQVVADLYEVDDSDVRHALRKHAPRPLRKKVNKEFREEIRTFFRERLAALPREMQEEVWEEFGKDPKGWPALPAPPQGGN
jgi:hypothetical protein